MSGHSIDLLPEAMRARSQAGMVASRNVGIGFVALAILVAVVTHSKYHLAANEQRLGQIRAEAQEVAEYEASAATLRTELAIHQDALDRYRRVDISLPLRRVFATVVELLPESVTLERVDFSTSGSKKRLSPRRGKSVTSEKDAARFMSGEIAGFAASDNDIAELVSALETRVPFRGVSLDYSRQRLVHERNAREFRISFVIDLESRYEVVDATPSIHREVVSGGE